MPTLSDLLIRIRGDGSQFRNDISEDQKQINGLVRSMDEIQDVLATVNVDDAEGLEKIRALKDEISSIRDETARIDVNTDEGRARLDELRTRLFELRDETVDINVDDTNAILALNNVRAQLAGMRNEEINVDVKTEGIGPLASLVLTTLPALSPLLATATAGALGLGAAFAAGGIGLAGFGAVAVPTIKSIFDAQTNLTTAQKAYNSATTDKAKQAALEKEKQAVAGLDSEQQKALKSLQNFQTFWGDFAKSFQNPVLDVFTKGLKDVQTLLNDFKPAFQMATGAVITLQDHFEAFLNTTDFKKFVNFVNQNALVSIVNFGDGVGNILRGVMSLMVDFGGIGVKAGQGFANLSANFANWAANFNKTQGFKTFMNYVNTNGPVVLDLIKNLGSALLNIIKDMAPVGSIVLKVADGLAKLINNLSQTNPMFITLAAGAMSAFGAFNLLRGPMSLFFKAGLVETVMAFGKAIFALGDAAKFAAAGEALMELFNPIGWIILAVAAVALIATEIITHWKQISTFTKNIWNEMVGFMKKYGLDILAAITGPIGLLVTEIAKHWDQIKSGAETAWNNVTSSLSNAWDSIKSKGQKSFSDLSSGIKNTWSSFSSSLQSKTQEMANGVVNGFKWLYNHNYYFKDLVDVAKRNWTTAQNDAKNIWNGTKSFLSSIWSGIKSKASSEFSSMKSTISTEWNAISSGTHSILSSLGSWISGQWSSMKSKASSAWSGIKSTLSSDAHSAASSTRSALSPLTGWISSIWSSVSSRTSSAWHSLRSSMSSGAHSAINAVKSEFSGLEHMAESWGSNMVHGFVSGITRMIGSVRSAASSVTKAAARFLGFHSPSEEGEGQHIVEWGENMIGGFIGGINNAVPKLRSTMDNVIKAPAVSVSSNVASMLSGMGSSTSSAQNVTHNWNLTLNGNIRNDQDIQKIAMQLQRFQRQKLGSIGG